MNWRFFILFCLTCMCLIGGSNWISKANAENSEPQASQSHKDHFIFDKEFILNRAKEMGISIENKDLKTVMKEIQEKIILDEAEKLGIKTENKSIKELVIEVRNTRILNQAKELGISTKRAGFDYIKKGILLMCDDPAALITKGVYPEIGKSYDPPVSDMQVEQSIRSAISDAWMQRNTRVWGYYFINTTGGKPKKPTNAEFISRIARILEVWQCCQKEVCYEIK